MTKHKAKPSTQYRCKQHLLTTILRLLQHLANRISWNSTHCLHTAQAAKHKAEYRVQMQTAFPNNNNIMQSANPQNSKQLTSICIPS